MASTDNIWAHIVDDPPNGRETARGSHSRNMCFLRNLKDISWSLIYLEVPTYSMFRCIFPTAPKTGASCVFMFASKRFLHRSKNQKSIFYPSKKTNSVGKNGRHFIFCFLLQKPIKTRAKSSRQYSCIIHTFTFPRQKSDSSFKNYPTQGNGCKPTLYSAGMKLKKLIASD